MRELQPPADVRAQKRGGGGIKWKKEAGGSEKSSRRACRRAQKLCAMPALLFYPPCGERSHRPPPKSPLKPDRLLAGTNAEDPDEYKAENVLWVYADAR